MSDNLGFGRIAESVLQPELAANDVFAKIDAYFSGAVAFDATSDGALTVEQSQSAQLVRIINCNADGRVLTLPATRRLYLLDMTAASNTKALTVVKGNKSITIPAGVKSDAYSDADANGLTLLGSAGTGGGDGGNGGGSGKAVKIEQFSLDDDVYGNTTLANLPTAGNLFVLFCNPYIDNYGFPSEWTVREWKHGANQDSVAVAYRTVTSSDTKSIPVYGSPRPEGCALLFELSGVTAADIDTHGIVLEAPNPTVSSKFTPTSDNSFIVGMATPSGPSAYYPQVMVGATVIGTMAGQGDRDDMQTGRSPAAFSGTATGTNEVTISATYSTDNTRALNLSYLVFKTGAPPVQEIPDPTGFNGKLLGVVSDKYALVDPPEGGGGDGGGTVGPVTKARYWRFLFQQAVGSNSNSAMGKIKIFAGTDTPVPATVLQYSTRLGSTSGPDRCFVYTSGPDDGWATANGDRTPFVDVDLGSAVQPTKFAFTSLGSSYFNLTMTFVEIYASQDGIAYFPVQSIIMPTLDDAAGVTVERGASNVGSSGGGGGGGGGTVVPGVSCIIKNPAGTPTLIGRGISAVQRYANASFKLTFTTPFPTSDWIFVANSRYLADGGSQLGQHVSLDRSQPGNGKTPNEIYLFCTYNGGSPFDPPEIMLMVYDPLTQLV